MQRRHPNAVRGGGSDDQSEGARMQPTTKAWAAPVKATESRRVGTGEGLLGQRPQELRDFLKNGGAGPWAADGLTVAAH